MHILREWVHRLWGTWFGGRREGDLEQELRLHVELATEEARRRGLAPDAAVRAAAIAAGGHTQAMEALREQRGLPWLDDLARDVRHGVRTLHGSLLFTAIVLVTLALGIGANTAIFSIVNGVILRPLGYPEPERLMYLNTHNPGFESDFPLAPAEYLEFRQINRSFADVGAYTTGEVNLTAPDRPLRVRAAFADDHLLNALGVRTAEGRVFATGETEVSGPWHPGDEPPPAAVAILSYELWQRAFGGRSIVGQMIEVDGRRREVIGIMTRGADVMDNHVEIWLPLGLNPATRNFRGYHILSVVGRLADGVTAEAAQGELNALMQNWAERAGPASEPHTFGSVGNEVHLLQMTPLQDAILGNAGRSIWVLQAAAGLVLLIACTNLANLFLARAETRRREFAIRTALGASRSRLLRQSMTEGVLLSSGGGLLAVALARLSVEALLHAYPNSLPRTSGVTVDLPVLLFTLCVSTATGLLFGLAPMLHTRAKYAITALKDGGDRGGTGIARHGVRRCLVIAEVALAVILVTGAGLLVKTVYNLTSVDPGFDRSRLVTFSIAVESTGQDRVADGLNHAARMRTQTYQRLLGRLRELPGVQAVTAMSGLPPSQRLQSESTQIDNYVAPPEGPYEAVDYYQSVVSGYFDTMGIPIVQGRGFQPTDASSPGMVAVVNERLVNTFWKGRNPIGQRLKPDWGDWVPWFTVIGVAKDVRQEGVDRNAGTEFYFLIEQMAVAPSPLGRAPAAVNVVLRTTLPPSALAQTIERTVRDVDPTVPVARLRDMDAVFAESIRRPRLLAQLIGAFAGLALLLAAVGTYGVFSYMVAARRREIGIRMALGAGRSSILGQVMKQGFQLTALGVVAGLAVASGLNRLIASMLFGVQPSDPATITAVIATIAAVAALGCWLPAFRASRLDPNVVLRTD
ncbi:MAG TPA: ABC transporter permease [Vicinamibacterales bacterium]|nr:ABC transporter permease [Vicinamibacterales bacterium]